MKETQKAARQGSATQKSSTQESVPEESADPKVQVASQCAATGDSGFTLRLAIDYGTINLGVAYHIVHVDDDDDKDPEIHEVMFDDGQNYQDDMWVQWRNDDPLVCSRQVGIKVTNGDLRRDKAFHMPKLAFYPDYEGSPARQLLEKQLQDIADQLEEDFEIGDLIQAHLKSIVEHAKDFIKTEQERFLAENDIDLDKIPMEVYLSVPQAWDPSSNHIMSEAAKAAGLRGQLVLEPQCVAAFAMYHELKHRAGSANAEALKAAATNQERQFVIDAGGGTVGLVKYGCPQMPVQSVSSKRKMVPEVHGSDPPS